MFNKLIPSNTKFFTMLEKSAELLEESGKALVEFIENPGKAAESAARLEQLEHDGDSVTHALLVMLDKSFITPIDREDIHELAQALDDCLDKVESVTERMQLYALDARPDATRHLAGLIREQTAQVHEALRLMPTFKYEKIIPCCKKISELESQADKAGRRALVDLFSTAAGDTLQVMKWKDIYDYLEDVADQCKHVANIVERIVLKHG
jgi:predicted phosphate transport protein (TIGR00153 family)